MNTTTSTVRERKWVAPGTYEVLTHVTPSTVSEDGVSGTLISKVTTRAVETVEVCRDCGISLEGMMFGCAHCGMS